jgi:hypothetical protein
VAKTVLPIVALCLLLGAVGLSTRAHAQVNDPLPTNCAGLRVMLTAEIDRMWRLRERATKEEKAPPADLVSAWQRTFGKKGDGVPALRELKKVRGRADTLNAALRARGCTTIDIDQALQARVQGVPAR